jgi:hypothetical protein
MQQVNRVYLILGIHNTVFYHYILNCVLQLFFTRRLVLSLIDVYRAFVILKSKLIRYFINSVTNLLSDWLRFV